MTWSARLPPADYCRIITAKFNPSDNDTYKMVDLLENEDDHDLEESFIMIYGHSLKQGKLDIKKYLTNRSPLNNFTKTLIKMQN